MPSEPTSTAGAPLLDGKPRHKNWLLLTLRKWHGWLGAAASLLIVVVCLSGLYLNHKDLFDRLVSNRRAQVDPVQFVSLWGDTLLADAAPSSTAGRRFFGRLTTATPPAALQDCLERALGEARGQWGDVPLEKVEFKFERGSLWCKVTSSGKEQLSVDASSGAVSVKEEKRKPEKVVSGGKPGKSMEPGKLIKELHTGKLGGLTGKLLVDLTSLSILALTFSGLYLWAWPMLRRRAAAP